MESIRVNERIIDTLNELIGICYNGKNGYETAAKAVENDTYRGLFEEYARQRAHFAEELRAEVTRLGGELEPSGKATAPLHRSWINLKAAVTDGDEHAILSECERGEDAAVEAYQDALRHPLPQPLRALVDRHYVEVKAAHDRIRALRDLTE